MSSHICKGRFQLQAIASRISVLPEEKIWRVTVEPYKYRRSDEQNNFAWRLYRGIAEETGYTAEEIHAICKHKFGEPRTVKYGETEIVEYSTRDKDTKWMADYLDRVQAWAASEFGFIS